MPKRQKALYFYSLIIFISFLIMQALTVSRLVLFGDDYYYTSFFYHGFEYFLSENIFHYMNTNGRALVHLIDELLLAGGNIILWQIFAPICMGLIVLFTALIASQAWKKEKEKERFALSLAISSLLFSFISIATASQTLYWATGFMNYVFPILLTLMLYYFTERGLDRGKFGVLYPLLALFASATTEQNAFVSMLILVYGLFRMARNKKNPGLSQVVALILGAIGIISLFASPGNAVRTTYYKDFYSLSIFERICQNVRRIVNLIFVTSGAARIIIVFLFAAGFSAFERKHGLTRLIILSLNLLAVLLLLFEMQFGGISLLAFAVSLLAFGVDSLILLPSLFGKNSKPEAFFTIMALICQGAMLISPEMGPRTILISYVFLIIPICCSLQNSENKELFVLGLAAILGLMSVRGAVFMIGFTALSAAIIISLLIKSAKKWAALPAMALVLLLTLNSLSPIFSGYRDNYVYHRENEALLREYRTQDESESRILKQKYLPNGYCKYTMPYDDPYHMHWFKIAKKLHPDTKIIYE